MFRISKKFLKSIIDLICLIISSVVCASFFDLLLVLPSLISLGFQTNSLNFISTLSFESSLTPKSLFCKNLKSTVVSVSVVILKESLYSSNISAHSLSFVVERKLDDS